MMPSIDSDAPLLRSCTQLKLRSRPICAGCARFYRRGEETRLPCCEELMAKLAEDYFTRALLDQFNPGSMRPRLFLRSFSSPDRTPTYRR
jgi:predicted amidophosphoribosyltransferase